MKKIFAIALAAVMVLSMASAFALNDCFAGFAWPCDADVNYCGRGTVEIVPLVKVNNGCGGFDWQISECAGAVSSEEVFYAVRLNVEANPDAMANFDEDVVSAAWWDAIGIAEDEDYEEAGYKTTSVVVSFNKALNDGKTAEEDVVIEMDSSDTDSGIDWQADVAKSYYYLNGDAEVAGKIVAGNDWIDVTDKDLDLADVVFAEEVADTAKASDAEVCAEIVSYDDGYGTWVYGDYTVAVAPGVLAVTDGTSIVTYTVTEDNGVKTEDVNVVGDEDFAAEVNKAFNLAGCTLGTCMTEKNVQKNFGWDTDGKVKDCFKWSAEAAAIVDAECVVAIPKTGDASLLAWLF